MLSSVDRGGWIWSSTPMTQNQQDSINEQQQIISDLRFFLNRANEQFWANKTVENGVAKQKAGEAFDKAVAGLERFKKYNNL